MVFYLVLDYKKVCNLKRDREKIKKKSRRLLKSVAKGERKMFIEIFEEILRLLQNTAFLIEGWKATEVWTIGKITMTLIVFAWVAGIIFFILRYLGKKIFGK